MNNLLKTLLIFVVAAISYAIFFGYPIMFLWNTCLVGAVDGIHPIGFGKALGIAILVGLLTYKADIKSVE